MITTTNAILPFPPHSPQDLAIPFFLTYVTDVGRSVESTRGFMEFVRPVFASERPSSALAAAVNAVAVKVWTTMGHRHVSESLSARLLSQALVRLRQAIDDPEERARDATVLSALVLQIHDTLSAVSGQAAAHGAHRNGALALLSQRHSSTHGSKYYAYLVGNLLHSRVSLSIRTGNALSSTELKWLETQVIPVLQMNPSSRLDIIGMDIAGLQNEICDQSSTSSQHLSALSDLRKRIQSLDSQLQDWLESLPQLWYRRRIQRGENIDPSIETYHGACDIYPSVQIVNIWNTWRIYRIILERAKSRLNRLFPHWSEDRSGRTNFNTEDITREVQELVDAICYSIPFYLGNCSRSGILLNMEGPHTTFPSYHDLFPSDDDFLNYKKSDQYVSRLDHFRHVSLHGPLHVISILCQLISLFHGAPDSEGAYSLRQDQGRWIAGQLVRSLHLMNMSPGCSPTMTKYLDHTYCSQDATATVWRAEILAKKFKEELWTITVL